MRKQQRGISLVEMMVAVAILTLILGLVFSSLATVQQRYRAEASRLDITQESREFVDQLVRDLRQSGYPGVRLYQSGVLGATPVNSPQAAAGIVAASSTDLWFEADLDGSGNVSSVRYTLSSNGGTCPCTLSRSVVTKVAGAPTSQGLRYVTGLEGLINSAGGAAAYPIAGNAPFAGVSNDTYYAGYKQSAVFTYLDSNGAPVNAPIDLAGGNLNAGVAAAANVASINIVVNVLSPNLDLKTHVRPGVSMQAMVRIDNR